MIEYPSILHWKKAPREPIVAQEKFDGSNFRAKWTPKKGFDLFGSRTQLITEETPVFGEAVSIFKSLLDINLCEIFKKSFRDAREIVVFGEFFGEKSFAGNHEPSDPKKLIIFDVLVGHKERYFLKPKEFYKIFGNNIETPRIVYEGNLNDEFIASVKSNKYSLNEGVVCKGLKNSGAHRGKMWMCKIKTEDYLNRLEEVNLDLTKLCE